LRALQRMQISFVKMRSSASSKLAMLALLCWRV
jgi:hypothetical protein